MFIFNLLLYLIIIIDYIIKLIIVYSIENTTLLIIFLLFKRCRIMPIKYIINNSPIKYISLLYNTTVRIAKKFAKIYLFSKYDNNIIEFNKIIIYTASVLNIYNK